jgi:hypothetical protein
MSLREDFQINASVLDNAGYQEIAARLHGLLVWMDSEPVIKSILDGLRKDESCTALLTHIHSGHHQEASSVKEISAVGLAMIELCRARKAPLWQIARSFGIQGGSAGDSVDTFSEMAMKRFIDPLLKYVVRNLPEENPKSAGIGGQSFIPIAIQESVETFRSDYPNVEKTCFIMMQFSGTPAHIAIENEIKRTLIKYGFTGLLASDKQFHDELYPNIQTYMHCCGFGIAVFERIETNDFNPNVSLEVGYMLGLKKRVLLLKEKTLKALHADLVGKLYKPFDVQDPAKSIPPQIEQWMEDKGLI